LSGGEISLIFVFLTVSGSAFAAGEAVAAGLCPNYVVYDLY